MKLNDPVVSRALAQFMSEHHLGVPSKARLARQRAREAETWEEFVKMYENKGSKAT